MKLLMFSRFDDKSIADLHWQNYLRRFAEIREMLGLPTTD